MLLLAASWVIYDREQINRSKFGPRIGCQNLLLLKFSWFIYSDEQVNRSNVCLNIVWQNVRPRIDSQDLLLLEVFLVRT